VFWAGSSIVCTLSIVNSFFYIFRQKAQKIKGLMAIMAYFLDYFAIICGFAAVDAPG
jgi:hypothetical protein